MTNKLYISLVIPIYNEVGNIKNLDEEIKTAMRSITDNFETIYINDGSTDQSLKELKALQGVKIIDLNRNYGQATALDAGFKAARGELIISLDGDGQNDPGDIPLLISELEKSGCDVVAGWRKNRQDPRNIRILTIIGRTLRKVFIGDVVHDSGCTLRVYKQEAVKSLDIGGEMHRYILALLRWKGFRISEVVVNHRPRGSGVSKYGTSKMLKGFIDLVYIWFIHKYSQRPLHLFGYLSFMSFSLGGIAAFWSIYGRVVMDLSLNRNGWFFLGAFFILAGIMLFSFGIITDLLIRTQMASSPHEKRYYIREVIEK